MRQNKEQPVKRSTWALVLASVLAGCASTSTTTQNDPSFRGSGIEAEQTDADRRARVRMELASGYYARGQLDTALDEVRQALAVKPDLPEAYNLRGLIFQSLGDDKLAEDNFKRALQINPRDADTMHNYGWFLCQSRRMPEAFAQFQQAIATPRYPGIARTQMALGVCQARTGAYADAERSLTRSYELDPTSPVTAFNLADVLYRRGEYERARFYIGRVNAVQEYSNAQTLWLAARIENKMGNARGARDYGRQLRSRFPQSPEALAFDRGRFDD